MSPLTKLVLVLLVSFEVNVIAEKTDVEREQLLTLSNAINDFSLNLFKGTAKYFSGNNIVISPLSADITLALLSMGAEGETQEEITTALHLPNAEYTKSAFATMIKSLNSTKDVTFNIANKIFVKNGEPFALSPQFKTLATDVFGTEVENVDFIQSEQAAQTMNSWVEEKTNKKMKGFISPSSLNAQTKIFLLNAICFEANWQNTFHEDDTYEGEFILAEKFTRRIKKMVKTDHLKYYKNSDWKAELIELPYQNGDLSMVIILPNEVDGLKRLIDRIRFWEDLTSAFKRLNQTHITIHLPKFKIESTINLEEILEKVWITKIFETGAELGGLLQSNESLYVTDAIQKAVIEVGEKGTAAVARTGTKINHINFDTVHPKFVFVNRPFLFCIKTRENIPIFIGQFTGVDYVF